MVHDVMVVRVATDEENRVIRKVVLQVLSSLNSAVVMVAVVVLHHLK